MNLKNKVHYIAHRVNTIDELKKLPKGFGVEVDIRERNGKLVLLHDPFLEGEIFENWLECYGHGTLILNIKEEGIEQCIVKMLQKKNINDYFFLDLSFPMIIKLIKQGLNKVALRFSEFESLETLKLMQGKCEWVWIDCFSKLPIDAKNFAEIKKMGYKTCLVSPDLVGRGNEIVEYRSQIESNQIALDAICCKSYSRDLWEN